MAPKHIGRYQVKAELDRGGMAVVFLARDPRFERDVAIKMLPREVRDQPAVRKRFEREAKVIAGLEHPSIVPVYDFGEDDRQPYLVMRYMTGGSLADRLHQRLGLRDAANIITRVASALDEAHDRGVVHRDLKPGNILFDSHGEAFLSDFGIVKMPEGTVTTVSSNSLVLGTPAYMSPEQAMGKEVDRRTDIYALGAVLYEVLTGMPPYIGPTPMSIAMKHVIEPVPTVKPIRPDLPEEVEDVISSSMAKNPDLRYETAGDMAIALNRVVQKYPLESASAPSNRRALSEADHAAVLSDTEEFELPPKIDVVISNESARKGSQLPSMQGRYQLITALPLLIGLVVTVGLIALGISASLARLNATRTVTPTLNVRVQIARTLTVPVVPTSVIVAITAEPVDNATATPQPTEQVAPSTPETPAKPEATATYVIVNLRALDSDPSIPVINFRAGPATLYRLLRTVPAGTNIRAAARAPSPVDGKIWYRVQSNDNEQFWVFSGSVKVINGNVLDLPFDNNYPPTPQPGIPPLVASTPTSFLLPTLTPQSTVTAAILTNTPTPTSTSTPTPTSAVSPTSSATPTSVNNTSGTITPVPFTVNGEIGQ